MEKYENETIAAIATALSDSGIGIVRISGENAIYIIDNIFRSAAGRRILTKVQSHTIHYGYIVDSDENVIDEVMVAVMKAPRSYTTEDTDQLSWRCVGHAESIGSGTACRCQTGAAG